MKLHETFEAVWIEDCHCGFDHLINLMPTKTPCWHYDSAAKTLSPSVLMRSGKTVCHFFLLEGKVQYLHDSTHAKRGLTIDFD